MKTYLQTKCPNCGSQMDIKDNSIECPACGTRYVSLYTGGVDVDVASFELDKLSSVLEQCKKEVIILGNTFRPGNVDDLIDEAKLKLADEALKNGDCASALKYSDGNGIEFVRIHYLAENKSTSESFLPHKCVWNILENKNIPAELCSHLRYRRFYSEFKKYCEYRDTAMKECASLNEEFKTKYLNLDKNIKDIAGPGIYEVLKTRAEQICKKYPTFPDAWLVLRNFDDKAVEKLFAVFRDEYFPFNELEYYRCCGKAIIGCEGNKEREIYETATAPVSSSISFDENDLQLIDQELKKRYPGAWRDLSCSGNRPFSYAACLSAQLPVPNGLYTRRNIDKYYSYDTRAQEIEAMLNNAIATLQSACDASAAKGQHYLWTYASWSEIEPTPRKRYNHRDIIWVKTPGSGKIEVDDYSSSTNHSFETQLGLNNAEAGWFNFELESRIKNQLGFKNYRITMVDGYYGFDDYSGRFPIPIDADFLYDTCLNLAVIAKMFKIEVWW